jgi:magnesium transporter
MAGEESPLARLNDALDAQSSAAVIETLAELHPAEIAHLLEALPPGRRALVWSHVDPDEVGEVLAESDEAIRLERLQVMPAARVAQVAAELDPDDAVDILQDLPEPIAKQVLAAMDAQYRVQLHQVLRHAQDTAGGLMNIDPIAVRSDVTLAVVVRYLRLRGEIPERTNRLMVVDRDYRFKGTLRLADLFTRDNELLVEQCMDSDTRAIPAHTPSVQVAQVFEQLNLLSAAVVDNDGRLIGRITIDDVVDVIREQGEESLMHMAGLDHTEDMFAPVLTVARHRALWLGVNLATALLASWVIGLFEATIQTVVALAVLMPVVASMGGIAGSQALTVVIRAMALGQVSGHNAWPLVRHELLIGAINSVLWALVVGLVALAWFGDPRLGVIVGVALIANLVVAAIAGALVPIGLRWAGVDPALAGGVVLTTVTDIVGFMTFLGLGALVLT